ncbi:hypothetical protein QA640_09230 [Bradyrhizobium sp. CB82]|uniref:hypothetical protein n=1 Tax=Bradyrhizobium sp. CB82 TaxID=3039159 RepID=UPI0024B1727D|nr:hypothetical protein [Bradyrhizobium sp. CB82]WFU42617.1 hypothetical protein QA640_09230 [Bradyrhizobium sp. CB82]
MGNRHDIRDLMERRRTSLLEQLEAVEREIAEYDRYQAELAAKYGGNAGTPVAVVATATSRRNGMTITDLIARYRNHEKSPYKSLKHRSREHYDNLLRLIERDYGTVFLADINAATFDGWHAKWAEGGKVAIAFSKIQMARSLFGFGTSQLEDAECGRLFGILGKKKFTPPKARTQQLTVAQADLIRVKARELERPSIALAQAFQSGVGLLQVDVIGQWVPMDEQGFSDVIFTDDEGRREKWIRGLRWNEIDDNLTLRHSSEREIIEFDLRQSSMVLDELRAQYGFELGKQARSALPSSGPIIVSEWSGIPWSAVEFRRWWRQVANACGIPKTVKNMDSRTKSGVTEGDEDSEGQLAL